MNSDSIINDYMRIKEGNKEKDIIEAAIKVFAEVGYHKAKISKIAEVASVATGSVYVYFKNKEDILLKIFEQLWEKIYFGFRELSLNPVLSPIEKIDSMIDLVFDAFIQNPSSAIVFVNEQNHLEQSSQEFFTSYYNKFMDEAQKVVNAGILSGVFSENIDISDYRIYVLGGLRTILRAWA